jgi:hypothetical protein
MDPNKKKSLMMAAGAAGLLVVVGALYYVFFMRQPAKPEEQAGGTLPEAGEATQVVIKPEDEKGAAKRQIYTIIEEPVIAPFLTLDGKIIYFSKKQQNLHETDLNGQNNRTLFSSTYPNIVSAEWNKNGSAALITTGDVTGNLKQYTMFSLTNKTDYKINQDDERIGPATPAPFDEKYLYQFRDTTSNIGLLSISDYDGRNASDVLAGGLIELNLSWPAKDKISFYHKTSGVAESNFFSYDLAAKTLKKMLSSVYGFSVKWSPNADYFLYSTTDNFGSNLSLSLSDEMGNIKSLNIDGSPITTIPEKCVFSTTEPVFYCAVMQNLPSDVVLPDDYYKGLVNSKDALYRFYIETGKSVKVPGLDDLPVGFNVEQMLMTEDNKYIFFVNKTDGYLYRFDLTVNPSR